MMNGMWVVLLWWLLGIVLLLKAPPIRRLVCKFHRQPPAVQATVALCLLIAVITGGTKPGGTNELSSSSQPVASAPENPSLIIQQSSLPSWWTHDATDTDDDGIPDLWEKWTHGNRQVADGGIDRDEDGLTDLEEFQKQTDPRTADTDGDGFDDAFEVVNGMDPTTPADFTPLEPDADNNGRIDLWENAPYIYGFTDADHDGFDDTYELNYLESASDGNFDVVVDVYTTRSAVLTWNNTNGIAGIVILPTTGTAVKLRLPVGVDTELTLAPSPDGSTTFGSNSLWKARARTSFMPRTAQAGNADFVACINGGIMHKVFESDSTIAKLPESSTSSDACGGIASLASAVTADMPPISIYLVFSDCRIEPPVHFYHDLGDIARTFSITNSVGIDTNTMALAWSVDFGSMTPASGLASTFSASSLPPDDGKATVSLTVDIGHGIHLAAYATVEPCPRHGFLLESFTSNFSPQLGESCSIQVDLPGCAHQNDPGWVQADIIRETISGIQLVAKIDMDPETELLDEYGDTGKLPSHPTFIWDGISHNSFPISDHMEDVFSGGTNTLRRALPTIIWGEAVPPPFYILRVKLLSPDTNQVVGIQTGVVYVPQVVCLEWDNNALDMLPKPIIHKFPDGESLEIFPGHGGSGEILVSNFVHKVQNSFPNNVNIRITGDQTEEDYFVKKIVVKAGGNRALSPCYGEALLCHRNATVGDPGWCELDMLVSDVRWMYSQYATRLGKEAALQSPPAFIPFSIESLLQPLANICTHEIGHLLGLVSPIYFHSGYDGHNPFKNQRKIMNYTIDVPLIINGNMREWYELNATYLEFILPKPK